jgi:hypothetical protein
MLSLATAACASAQATGRAALRARNAYGPSQRCWVQVAVFESTSAGLVQAALQSVAGASVYTTCGAVTYHSSRAVAVLGCDMSGPRPADAEGYIQ